MRAGRDWLKATIYTFENITKHFYLFISQEDNFITCLIDDAPINNNNEGADLSKQKSRQFGSDNFNNNNSDVMSPESNVSVNGVIRTNKKFQDEEVDRVESEIKKEVIDADEYIDVDEDSNSHVDNSCKLKTLCSPDLEDNTLDLTKGISESKVKCELNMTQIQDKVSIKKENPSSDQVLGESETDEASRYCTTCDITFNYASSLIAHKKFYCPKVKV